VTISTLVVVVLFHPVRRHTHRVIERRFYRSKYDSEVILSSFSETLRNQIDLTALHAEVLHVVETTVQPRHSTLWLRNSGDGKLVASAPHDPAQAAHTSALDPSGEDTPGAGLPV
jgi:hypothetical protein